MDQPSSGLGFNHHLIDAASRTYQIIEVADPSSSPDSCVVQCNFFFWLFLPHYTTIHLLGAWRAGPFPGIFRLQNPSTTMVNYVRVFLLDLVTNSRLSFFSSWICFVAPFRHGVVHQQMLDLLPFQGVKPGHSGSNH